MSVQSSSSSKWYDRQPIYEMFVTYFENPTMTKMHDDNNHSVYMAWTKSLLANGYRYLIAIVPLDVYFIGDKVPLDSLPWISFQTRLLPTKNDLQHTHSYRPKANIFNQCKMIVTQRKDTYSIYEINTIPIRIIMLHTPKDKLGYGDTAMLSSALETYQTVVEFI